MPFTPSHAVVALPFVRTPLVPAAIAVGAMTPDLPLFVRVGIPTYATTHDPAALGFTLILSLALLLVWRCGLRPATRELLPAIVAGRLPAHWDGTAAQSLRETFGVARGRVRAMPIAVLVTSLAVGILSHIVWDAFSHEGRWGVEMVPALSEQWGPLLGLKWVQHGSSAVGLGVLAIWAALWLRSARTVPVSRVLPGWVRRGWWASLPIALIAAGAIGLAVHGPLDDEFTPAHLAYRVLPPACAIWGVATLGLAIAVPLVRTAETRGKQARHARDAS